MTPSKLSPKADKCLTENHNHDSGWTEVPHRRSITPLLQKGGRAMADGIEMFAELSGTERLTIEAISRDADVPLIEVANLYKVERSNLECDAKIPTFIPVLASRNVRIKLKRTQQAYWTSVAQH